MPPIVDPEIRTESLGDESDEFSDVTAFAGMPNDYRRVVLSYVESVVDKLHATPLTRERHYHADRSDHMYGLRFPDDPNPVLDRKVLISLVILPRPEAVHKWIESIQARKAGWRAMDDALNNPGTVFGHTLIFEAGERSEEPHGLPAAPMGTLIPSWSDYVPGLSNREPFFLQLGKIVLHPFYHDVVGPIWDGSRDLHLGEVGGATLLGDILTVPLHLENQKLRWACRKVGTRTEQFLAYSLIDGNGAMRSSMNDRYQMSDIGRVSPYLRPLDCKGHQPRIKQHDLLLLPVPLGWPPKLGENSLQHPHEEWSFDDWFPAQPDACWVVRETADSKPLKESFVLMPAREESELPVFLIVLFAETEPAQLVRELSSLYKVPADPLLTSEEHMGHLLRLYEKILASPFD